MPTKLTHLFLKHADGQAGTDLLRTELLQHRHALGQVAPATHRSAAAEPTGFVLTAVGEVQLLLDVLDRDEAAQPVAFHQQQLLDLLAVEDPLRLVERAQFSVSRMQ